MEFQSLLFIIFILPVFLFFYQISSQKNRKIFIIIFSLFLYTWQDPCSIFILLFLLIMNYLLIKYMDEIDEKRRLVDFLVCVIMNVFLLFYVKYYGFVLNQLSSIIHLPNYHALETIPLGISFYVFSLLSYDIDVYLRKIEKEYNIIDFAFYVSFFPKLIMGPIIRYQDFKTQGKLENLNKENLEKGFELFLLGCIQKVCIANQLAPIWDIAQGTSSAWMAWLGIFSYTLQIYFDFQGYTLMAIGVARMIGIYLPDNFQYPYCATSITDFWRRWHKTLSFWFRDYIYIPLGGNRKGVKIHIRNLIIVWILTGLWHGANWTFIVWGLYYGVILIFEKYIWMNVQKKLPNYINWFITFIIVMLGWVFFASSTIQDALQYLKIMFLGSWKLNSLFYIQLKSSWWILGIGFLCSISFIHKICINIKINHNKIYIVLKIIIICLAWLFFFMYSASDTMQSFLYFQF